MPPPQSLRRVKFSTNPQVASAYLVLVASIGDQVSYTLTAEAVSDGEDGGVADAADGGDVPDAGADADAGGGDEGVGADEGNGGGDGCGCGAGATQSLLLLLLFVFLPLRSRLRFPVGR